MCALFGYVSLLYTNPDVKFKSGLAMIDKHKCCTTLIISAIGLIFPYICLFESL